MCTYVHTSVSGVAQSQCMLFAAVIRGGAVVTNERCWWQQQHQRHRNYAIQL